jgi:FecR protein
MVGYSLGGAGMSKRPLSVFASIGAGILICLGAVGTALAQDEPQGDQTQMIEQLGEARAAQLSYAEGSVSLEPAGTNTWTAAAINRPLTLGDRVWADRDSRAEIDIGDAVIRLGSTTGFSFLNLDEQTAQMQVTAGTVIVHIDSLASGEQDEIDTPNVALTLQQAGTYRVEVNDSGDTTVVKVAEGAALATGGGQSYPVAAQQSVTFTGTSALAAEYATLGAPDSLDDWSLQRDQQEQQQAAVAQDYVPPDTVGGDDLGSYGSWQDTPDWGYAWFPSVDADWAPYSLGYWVWISPWGWTWVDDEPWGYAPFHYGRWGYSGHRWCWIPGPRGVRPVYAPALVAWVGGAGVGVAAGARVGWLPLGPGDRYGAGATNARFVNSGVPGAVTVVPRNVFTSALPVHPHRVTLPQQSMASLRPTTAAPAIAPGRQSVLGMNAGMSVKAPPNAIAMRPVVARLAPPRAPVSFAAEQAAIRANGGRPLSVTQLSRMRPYTPAVPVRLTSPTRSNRPPGAAGQPTQSGAQRAAADRYVPSQRGVAPQQHLNLPPREVPQQHFTAPERQIPPPHFSPPREQARPPAPPAAPSRAPESRPDSRPPPDRRADVAAPPMYRAQVSTIRYAALPQPAGNPYRPPLSPPPMYRPIPLGPATARPAPSGSARLANERPRQS